LKKDHKTFLKEHYRLCCIKNIIKLIQVVIFSILIAGCEQQNNSVYYPKFTENPPKLEQEFIFGVFPGRNPQRLFEVFGPMIDYLSENVSGAHFKLEASRNYAVFDKKLYTKQFHFALPNPFQTINAIDKGYQVFGKMSDDENFRGIILIRKDSKINRVSDLKGSVVSYPAPTALAATMMPQYFLQSHGVDVMTELDNRYVGSQESSIMNVFLGQSIAASTWPPPWKALSAERPELAKQLTIKWETEPLINNGLVVLPSVSDEVTEQVTNLVTQLHEHAHGKEMLKRMQLSRFEKATNETYLPVRDFIKKFSKEVRTP